MKLRGKLLLLLLAMTGVPLLTVTLADHLGLRLLGRELAQHARTDFLESAQLQLRTQISAYAKQIKTEMQLISTLLWVQAQAVETRLAQERTAPVEPIYFDTDFEAPDVAVPGRGSFDSYRKPRSDGSVTPLPISFETQSIRLPVGVDRASLAPDLAALEDMTPVYRAIDTSLSQRDLILWQYTALNSGVLSSYPGTGGYPQDYDARKREWFVATLKKATADAISGAGGDQTHWLSPMVDATTKQLTIVASRAVRGPGGQVAGVTSMDVPLASVFSAARLPTKLAKDGHMLLVVLVNPEQAMAMGVPCDLDAPLIPMIVADEQQATQARDWHAPRKLERFTLDEASVLQPFIEDVSHQQEGVRMGTLGGEMSIVAYGPIGDDAAVVLIAPHNVVDQQVEQVEQAVWDRTWVMLEFSTAVVALVGLIVFFVAWFGSRRVTAPIAQLAVAARHIADGDLDARAHVRPGADEISDLAQTFNDMVPKLEDRLVMRESLNLAKEVQQALLPQAPPTMPGFEIAGQSVYCDETGGDYFDFIALERAGRPAVGVVVGDVVGHGIAAALLMATVRALLRTGVAQSLDLSTLMRRVNDGLCEASFTGRFVTLFYLELTANPVEVCWLSAGHDAAFVYDPTHDRFAQLAGDDLPLGIQPGGDFIPCQDASITWAPDQIIFMGTDGIWEAFNPEGVMFGKDRLKDVLRTHAHASAEEINQAVQDAVAAFRGTRSQMDDITSVVVKIKASLPEMP